MDKMTIKIDGMACAMCEAHIKDVIRKTIPDAKKVTASCGKGEASFITAGADEEKLKKAIADTGYKFVSAKSEPYEKKGLFW